MRHRIANATDLRLNLDRIAAPRDESDFIFLEGIGPQDWEGCIESHLPRHCPVCGGNPLPLNRYCARCDRTGVDGRVTLPGLAVGSCLDPTWHAEPTRYVPEGKLRGGR
jgi:hypothetical protein